MDKIDKLKTLIEDIKHQLTFSNDIENFDFDYLANTIETAKELKKEVFEEKLKIYDLNGFEVNLPKIVKQYLLNKQESLNDNNIDELMIGLNNSNDVVLYKIQYIPYEPTSIEIIEKVNF